MPLKHLPDTFWKRLLHGEPLSPEVKILVRHHLEVCAACRVQAERTRSGGLARRQPDAGAPQARKKAGEQRDLLEILGLSPERRRLRIRRALRRFKSLGLVGLLVQESRESAPAQPLEALDLAECAYDVAMRLEHSEIGRARAMTALARANAARGNALRATGNLKQADRLLTFALDCFEREGDGDAHVEAEIRTLMASLRCDQRRFTEAEDDLNAVIHLYRVLEDPVRVGRALVQKGVFLAEAANLEGAIQTTCEALSLLDPRRDGKLYLAAEHNLTDCLVEAGDVEEARRRFVANAGLYASFSDPWTQLRRRWLEGKIARNRGDLVAAVEIFHEVRQGFNAESLGFFAALAGLDLALVYIQQGQAEEVRSLAEEMVPIFLAQDIQREAAAALLLFQKAARRKAVSARMVIELAASMRRARGCGHQPEPS